MGIPDYAVDTKDTGQTKGPFDTPEVENQGYAELNIGAPGNWEPYTGTLGAVSVNPLETQEGGTHYKDMGIQPIEYIHGNNMGFLEGNVIKYVSRHASKNGLEDLKKAKHYIDLLIKLEYSDAEEEST